MANIKIITDDLTIGFSTVAGLSEGDFPLTLLKYWETLQSCLEKRGRNEA